MKTELFKKLIKECVREVFQEEIKEILLESIRNSKTVIQEVSSSTPNYKIPLRTPDNSGEFDESEVKKNLREMYMNSMNGLNTQNIPASPKFVPHPVDVISEGSSLPEGEVDLSQIMNLMK